MSTQEQWRPVFGFEDLYEISDSGRVVRIATYKGRPMRRPITPQLQPTGYLRYWLSRNSRHFRLMAHRLVWTSFHGAIPDDLVINHQNGDKVDNRLSNLEVVTQKRNVAHSLEVLGCVRAHGARHHNAKLDDAKVMEIRALRAAGATLQKLADEFGVDQSTISSICNRETWVRVS